MGADVKINWRSVRFRITAGAALALGLLVAVSGFGIDWLVGREVRRAADASLLEQAQDRARLFAEGADATALVTIAGHEVVVVVVAPTGAVLASSGTSAPESVADLEVGLTDNLIAVIDNESSEEGDERDETDEIDQTERGDDSGDEIDETDERDEGESGDGEEGAHLEWLRTAVVETSDGSRVIVGTEGTETEQTTSAVRTILLVGAPIMAVVGALISWFVAGRALAPVYRLRTELDGVVRLSDDARVDPPDTEDEIHALAVTINELLGRLERQSAARREFVADASHELKSPVANARALLETSESDDGESSTGVTARVIGELDRLQALVDDLLYLARTDETTPLEPAIFDLDDVMFDEAERAAIRTPLTIDASRVQPARALGDRSAVSRAVRNLVENAVRHGESQVRLGLEPEAGAWVVVVADDGPGIPAADRQRIFDRFARLDHDRSRRDGGTGLGLSIVASVASRSEGSVRVADTSDPGARLELRLPRAD